MSPMPDRAVVDDGSMCPATKDGIWPHSWSYGDDATGEQGCLRCGAITIPKEWTPRCPRCGDDMQQDSAGDWKCGNHLLADDEPAPRALVALSEDRQWLCVLEPELEDKQATSVFTVWRWDIRKGHVLQAANVDTGQDAHEVLAAFMEERDER